MSSNREHSFDTALLSGYLDGVLTQQDAQRVRLHIDACPECANAFDHLKTLREDTMSSAFVTPPDDQWDERPQGIFSGVSFGIGWAILIAWLVGIIGFALGQLWTGPASLVEKLLAFSAITGITLVFLSVLIDRLKRLGSDRYRRIDK